MLQARRLDETRRVSKVPVDAGSRRVDAISARHKVSRHQSRLLSVNSQRHGHRGGQSHKQILDQS